MPVMNGVAFFSGLTLDKPGVGYIIQATAIGLTDALSAPITAALPKVTTQTALSSSKTVDRLDQTVTFKASVSTTSTNAPLPGGFVTFKDNATTIGIVMLAGSGTASTASLTYKFTKIGSHSITAVYTGDSGDIGSISKAVALTVRDTAQNDDFGGGTSEMAVFRPSTAQWYTYGPTSNRLVGTFGAKNLQDIPVPGDYDGVGHDEMAVFRPATAQWFVMGPTGGRLMGTFGGTNDFDIPVPGDYDGLGHDELAVFRPSTGQWIVHGVTSNRVMGTFGATNLHDIPVPGDYDGVGHDELAIFRPSTGQWFVQGPTGNRLLGTFGGLNFFDIPVPGDYDGVGHDEMAVFRPSTGQWFVDGPHGPYLLGTFGATKLFDVPAGGPIGSMAALGLFGGIHVYSVNASSLGPTISFGETGSTTPSAAAPAPGPAVATTSTPSAGHPLTRQPRRPGPGPSSRRPMTGGTVPSTPRQEQCTDRWRPMRAGRTPPRLSDANSTRSAEVCTLPGTRAWVRSAQTSATRFFGKMKTIAEGTRRDYALEQRSSSRDRIGPAAFPP